MSGGVLLGGGEKLREKRRLLNPKDDLQVIQLGEARPTDFLRSLHRAVGPEDGVLPVTHWLMALGLTVSKSDYLENKDLDHNLGKASFTMPTTVALALCTASPSDSSTGATITEASYTGYARKKIEAASLNAASSGKTTNSAVLEFAACTAGSSTVTAFAILDSTTIGAGNILYWGTVTSTVISTTQTPATVAIAGLEITED